MKKLIFLGTGLTGALLTAVGLGIRLGNKGAEDEYNEKINEIKKNYHDDMIMADEAYKKVKKSWEEAIEYNNSLKECCDDLSNKNKELEKDSSNLMKRNQELLSTLSRYKRDLSKEEISILENNIDDAKIKLFDLRKTIAFSDDEVVRDKACKDMSEILINIASSIIDAGMPIRTALDYIEEYRDSYMGMDCYMKEIITKLTEEKSIQNEKDKMADLHKSISNIIADIEVITNQVSKETSIDIINKKSKKVSNKIKYIRNLVRSSEFDDIRDSEQIKSAMKVITKLNSKYKKTAEKRISYLNTEGV